MGVMDGLKTRGSQSRYRIYVDLAIIYGILIYGKYTYHIWLLYVFIILYNHILDCRLSQ